MTKLYTVARFFSTFFPPRMSSRSSSRRPSLRQPRRTTERLNHSLMVRLSFLLISLHVAPVRTGDVFKTAFHTNDCRAGNFRSGQDSCVQCPSGTYSSENSALRCTACPRGMYSHPGAASAGDCRVSQSMCPPSFSTDLGGPNKYSDCCGQDVSSCRDPENS